MEHAAAAAGATIGTGAGKALSSGIDKVLGKAAETGSNAAKPVKVQTAAPPAAPRSAPVNQPPATSQALPAPAGGSQHARSRNPVASADRDKPLVAAPEVPEPTPVAAPAPLIAVAPPPLTAEDFAKVKEGASRDEVLAALGVPSSHITIPDDGHLIEILSYSNGERRIGSVRIDNGTVVTVSVAQ